MARVRAKKERQQVRDRAEARRSLNNQAIDREPAIERVSAKKKAKDDESFGAGI